MSRQDETNGKDCYAEAVDPINWKQACATAIARNSCVATIERRFQQSRSFRCFKGIMVAQWNFKMISNATVNWLRSRLVERTDPKDGSEAKSPRISGRKLIHGLGITFRPAAISP
jgi:hypothetical protein